MRMCTKHWDALKARVNELDMGHLVSKNPEEAMERTVKELNKEEVPVDPLMRSYWMITNRALEAIGLGLMMQNEDGTDKCPQCEYNRLCGCPTPNCADVWTQEAPEAVAQWLAEEQAKAEDTQKTIECMYTCEGCGLVDRKVNVPERKGDTDVVLWVGHILGVAISKDHSSVSPQCTATKMANVKIPLSDDARIGENPTN